MMLPETLQTRLLEAGVTDFGESALREALEARVETYTLIKLAPWAARRWKCRYRLMMGDALYDAQSVAEAYALGIQAAMLKPPNTRPAAADSEPPSQK
ncbi:MAG TPA: hypothetical protein VGT82_01100 [Ktedonobacteraceae bacterium]|nr:hypothetical protein [Ktedonobacteraceae bacterium]